MKTYYNIRQSIIGVQIFKGQPLPHRWGIFKHAKCPGCVIPVYAGV